MVQYDISKIPEINDPVERKKQGPPYKYTSKLVINGEKRDVIVIVPAKGKRLIRVITSRRKVPEIITMTEAQAIFLEHVLSTNRDKNTRSKRVLKQPTRSWAKHPGKYDVEGIDTPEVKQQAITRNFLKGKIRISEGQNQIAVVSPYHPDFITGARKLHGKWSPSKNAWIFDSRDRDRIVNLLGDVYGYGSRVFKHKRIKIGPGIDNPYYRFGRLIVERRYRDAGVKLGEGVIILKGKFSGSAGSSKYPQIFRTNDKPVILLIRDVPAKKTR